MTVQEPSAENRAAARQVRDIYVALVAEGFTTREALDVIGMILAANTTPEGDQS